MTRLDNPRAADTAPVQITHCHGMTGAQRHAPHKRCSSHTTSALQQHKLELHIPGATGRPAAARPPGQWPEPSAGDGHVCKISSRTAGIACYLHSTPPPREGASRADACCASAAIQLHDQWHSLTTITITIQPSCTTYKDVRTIPLSAISCREGRC